MFGSVCIKADCLICCTIPQASPLAFVHQHLLQLPGREGNSCSSLTYHPGRVLGAGYTALLITCLTWIAPARLQTGLIPDSVVDIATSSEFGWGVFSSLFDVRLNFMSCCGIGPLIHDEYWLKVRCERLVFFVFCIPTEGTWDHSPGCMDLGD